MAIRKIRFIGDPCLNKVCKPVQKITPSIETLIEDMFDTMYEARGVGLAAPQIGILRRVVVIDIGEGLVELVNPEIIYEEGEKEGCLEALLEILKYKDNIPEKLEEKLKQQDAKTLKKWLRLAVRADNIGQFENAISE